MKLITTNGPPHSGKDTICKIIKEGLTGVDIIPMSYKETLYIGVANRYNLNIKAVFDMNADPDVKDIPSGLFNGKSVRQALIFESEEVIKKEYGPQGVAIKTFKLLEERYGKERLKNAVLLCSDGGFNSELQAYYDYFKASVEDVYIIRMLRKGCSFAGDSREFLNHPDVVISNDSGMDHLKTYLPVIQAFADGFVISSSRTAHIRRDSERKTYLFLKSVGINSYLKSKALEIPKPKKDRNKGHKPSQTLTMLMDKIDAK